MPYGHRQSGHRSIGIRPVAGRPHATSTMRKAMHLFAPIHRLARPSRHSLRLATLCALLGILSGLLAPFGVVPGSTPIAEAQVIQGSADTLVSTGVRDYTLAGSKI